MKRALVTGITGQDGAYLAEYLLSLGYAVIGTKRRSSSGSLWRLERLGIVNHEHLTLIDHDLTDQGSNIRLLERTEPDEIYNLAAQTFVGASFDQPITTAMITGLGAVHLLEAVREVNPAIRFYQASTSEMYGNATESPQNEDTPFAPRSPYGCAKLYAHQMAINYREYGIFTACGILFNHEGPLRSEEFVTRKIVKGLVEIKNGTREYIELGNLEARRDWGHARDYVRGMHLMLQAEVNDCFVLATGKTFSVREFIGLALISVGLEPGMDHYVRINPKFYRPAEIHELRGDYSKASRVLGWKPTASLAELITEMVEHEQKNFTAARPEG